MMSIPNAKNRTLRLLTASNATSDCAIRGCLYVARIPHLVFGIIWCFCSHGCKYHLSQYEILRLIHSPIEYLMQHKINLSVSIMYMILAVACFMTVIVITLTGRTWKI